MNVTSLSTSALALASHIGESVSSTPPAQGSGRIKYDSSRGLKPGDKDFVCHYSSFHVNTLLSYGLTREETGLTGEQKHSWANEGVGYFTIKHLAEKLPNRSEEYTKEDLRPAIEEMARIKGLTQYQIRLVGLGLSPKQAHDILPTEKYGRFGLLMEGEQADIVDALAKKREENPEALHSIIRV